MGLSPLMIVRLHYADGKTEDHPLKNGEHFADYIRKVDVPKSEFAFAMRSQQMRYLTLTPGRDAMLTAIEFVKGPDPSAPRKASVRDVTSILRGIPQEGLILGDPKAPVLLVEFADLQCPFCREFAASSWPDIVKRYIRTGKVRMDLRLTSILGEDSAKANKAVMAAGLQNRMWDASMRFYDVQGQEGSGYVTDPFLRGVLLIVGHDQILDRKERFLDQV